MGMLLLTLLIYVIVAALVAYILMWAVGYIGLAEPFDKIARVIVVLIILLMAVGLLTQLVGHPIFRWW